MMLTPLQLPSVHHDPSHDRCAYDVEVKLMWKELVEKM